MGKRIGLVDVDGHNYPNYALMKISAYHKSIGDSVEWANPLFGHYDKVYESKIFTFTPPQSDIFDCEVVRGGTGYDIQKKLPEEIENIGWLDYSIYPQYPFSLEFFSRGCIRHCPFCLVHDKEGGIHAVEPVPLNPKGEWIEVLDNNFFASPEWHKAIEYLLATKQKVNLHGVDVRIMSEEQAYWLNKLRLKTNIHIAWDLPKIDLTEKLREVIKYIKPHKLTCYVLVGFNSTPEEDLYRLRRLKELHITPFVQPYRDFENKRTPTQYEKDVARWANRLWFFKSMDFNDFSPRRGFKCSEYGIK
jgi:hypothetical protein